MSNYCFVFRHRLFHNFWLFFFLSIFVCVCSRKITISPAKQQFSYQKNQQQKKWTSSKLYANEKRENKWKEYANETVSLVSWGTRGVENSIYFILYKSKQQFRVRKHRFENLLAAIDKSHRAKMASCSISQLVLRWLFSLLLQSVSALDCFFRLTSLIQFLCMQFS